MITYLLLTAVGLVYIVSAVLQVRQARAKSQADTVLASELASLKETVTALEAKAVSIQNGQRATAGDLNSVPR
jgi:cell division protein FtsB